MAINASNGSNAVSAYGNNIHLLKSLQSDDRLNVHLRMSQALQTSLELSTLLQTFFDLLQPLVSAGGMHFRHQASDCRVELGQTFAQKLNYRLQTTQQQLGELTFYRRKRFREEEMAAIENLIPMLIYPLRNALLYREALIASMQDPLTGIGNRAALMQALRRQTHIASRHQQPMSILMVDLDHFKSVNDEFGHSCGDQVLLQLAHTIRENARQTDQSYRYGGEEFVLLLDQTDLEGAGVFGERLRQQIANLEIETARGKLRVSASIGVAQWREGESGEEVFDRADAALYQAKHEGRNRVIIAPDS